MMTSPPALSLEDRSKPLLRILVAAGLLIASSTPLLSQQRSSPYVSAGTIWADNGRPIRGGRFTVDIVGITKGVQWCTNHVINSVEPRVAAALVVEHLDVLEASCLSCSRLSKGSWPISVFRESKKLSTPALS